MAPLLAAKSKPISLAQRLALSDAKISFIFPQQSLELQVSVKQVETRQQLSTFIQQHISSCAKPDQSPSGFQFPQMCSIDWQIKNSAGTVTDLSTWNAKNEIGKVFTVLVVLPNSIPTSRSRAPFLQDLNVHNGRFIRCPSTHVILSIGYRTQRKSNKKKLVDEYTRTTLMVGKEETVSDLLSAIESFYSIKALCSRIDFHGLCRKGSKSFDRNTQVSLASCCEGVHCLELWLDVGHGLPCIDWDG